MPRYVAFLRGINVGGHTVTNGRLREVFSGLGLAGVDTFIASGNVIFDADRERAELERLIEAALGAALGYEVPAFLRTDREIAGIAAYEPFPDVERREGDGLFLSFLRAEPDAATRERVLALANEHDLLHIAGPDLYWLRRGGLRDATISAAQFDRALGRTPTTVRNVNTVRRLAAKYPPLDEIA